MWRWFKKTQKEESEKPADLHGGPRHNRLKSYSASSGYAYQYVYRGYRASGQNGGDREYVFEASRDRRVYRPLTVLLQCEAVRQSTERRGRVLLDVEQYAIAKISLFEAFDREEDVFASGVIRPQSEDIARILELLGRT